MRGDEILLAEADLMALVGQGVANVELLRRRIAAKDAYITELEAQIGGEHGSPAGGPTGPPI